VDQIANEVLDAKGVERVAGPGLESLLFEADLFL
jgi:hypothetical protein